MKAEFPSGCQGENNLQRPTSPLEPIPAPGQPTAAQIFKNCLYENKRAATILSQKEAKLL